MKAYTRSTVSEELRRAIIGSGLPFQVLERETGVTRASISRFVAGKRTLRLDMVDKLAPYLGLMLVKEQTRRGSTERDPHDRPAKGKAPGDSQRNRGANRPLPGS